MKDKPKINWQRGVIGGLGLVCLTIGLGISLMNLGSATGLQGILVRLGVVLITIWLAMPQLGKLSPAQSVGGLIIVLALVVLAASRPNLFRIAASLLVIGLALNWGLKWLSCTSQPPRK